MATAPPVIEQNEESPEQASTLAPLNFADYDYVPGKYASWNVSPEPIFGPDQLGEYKAAIDDMNETAARADSSARIWEVLQAWELRLMCRNYQFLTSDRTGWSLYGAARGTPQSIAQTQNSMKLFSCNVLGAREDKIVAALSREVPGITFVPRNDNDPMDQTAADEAKKYVKVWLTDAGIKEQLGQTASFFYTDDRVVLYTRSVADEQHWDTETPEERQETFDAPSAEGISPETELQSSPADSEVPAVRELTTAYGKLECKVPIAADSIGEMPWVRVMTEQNVNILKERYPWIEDKIVAGASLAGTGSDQMDRMARINVRLIVQTSSSSGESWQQDATETLTWYRPSQYRAIKNKDYRKVFYDNFPDGLLVVHAGSELALVRNEGMNDHLTILHSRHGSGQNRRAIGTNYAPLQKILNANISLIDRYFRAAIPRRFALEGPIDNQAMNAQMNDPGKSTPVSLEGLPPGTKISDITGVENVPSPNTAIFEFVQWLIQGAPEAMDGASPAMFGMEDAETFGQTKLNRDQALQVFSMPWSQICTGFAMAAQQAAACAGKNRVASIRSNVPGQGKLEIEIGKLRGNALAYPESLEIPQTLAEQEARMADLLENGKNVALYQAIASDPQNLPEFSKFPSLCSLNIPGVDAVEQQQGEFELLMQSGPVDNPMLAQIQMLIQQAETSPEAQMPEGQQMLAQLQQQAQALPPKVSSVPVAQDGSENHQIHAAITLGMLTSATGRKLKFGDEQQQQIYQNLKLHWQEHVEMAGKLTPPKEIEMKGTVTVDPTKLPPDAQAKAFQAIGLQVSPQELQPVEQEHEVTQEQEGIDPATGVPTKRKISVVGKPLN